MPIFNYKLLQYNIFKIIFMITLNGMLYLEIRAYTNTCSYTYDAASVDKHPLFLISNT